MPSHSEREGCDFQIGMIIFDGMTNLDFVGPADAFARMPDTRISVLAKSLDPVVTDSGCRVVPDTALDDAPSYDLLFIGGGPGTTTLMEDEQVLEFLISRAPDAAWVTSVCTGALVLGAAGLLRGYKAATHWTVMDLLPLFGAEPVDQRVVIDRNRITGGGVTAGIDFGLTIINHLHGPDLAQLVQLGMEYNPQPPFQSGSPASAPAEVVERFRGLSSGLTARRREAAQRLAAKHT